MGWRKARWARGPRSCASCCNLTESRAEPMLVLDHDGLRFHYRDEGKGLPFVFQHGLGGDLSQPLSVYRPGPGIRLLGFDARGHGRTHPLGDLSRLSIAGLADDLLAFLDHLGVDRAVI